MNLNWKLEENRVTAKVFVQEKGNNKFCLKELKIKFLFLEKIKSKDGVQKVGKIKENF